MNWEFWTRLFDPTGFVPRRLCGAWTPDLIWLHNSSDFLIWTAYLAIPIVLVSFAWKRRHELAFRSIFWLFGIFIVACGTTHLMDIVMFYNPLYRLSGLVKLITAAASWGTVLALVRLVPAALAMKTPRMLEHEIVERQRAEEQVRVLNAELEERVRARTAELQASTERFAAIVSSSAHIIWTRDVNGEFSTPQPSWSAFTGRSFEESRGRDWLNAIHPDDREHVERTWQQAVKTGEAYEIEYSMRRHDGEYRSLEVHAVPVRDENGAIREWVGTSTDVTERRAAETALRESQSLFQSMADSIPQLAWMADPSGDVFWYNQRWYDYTGSSFEDMQGWGWEKVHHPDHVGHCVESWQTALRNGTPWEDTFPLRSKVGEYRWFLSRALPIRDEAGAVIRWFGTNTDITAARQTELELRESEARKSAILESALDCIIGINQESNVIEWNPAAEKTFGYSREEVLGQPLCDLIIPPVLRATHLAGMSKYLATGEGPVLNRRIEISAMRHGGEEFPVELAITRIAREGAPLFTAYLRDITVRKQTEIDLERARVAAEVANKTKSLFLANMSHELRTPLNAILGYSEMLQEEVESGQVQDFMPDLQKINAAGKHLLSLINDILDLSKIEAGKMEIFAEDFDVCEMIGELSHSAEPLMKKNHNTLRIKCAPGLGEAHSDLMKLRQCILNLLSNAAKFTQDGEVVLDARSEATNGREWLVFGVTDSGIGMSADEISKLFRPFTQADASTTRRFGGSGLGLALTRRFCQMLGGDVSVSSTPGEGSTFTIKVPAALTDLEAQAETAAEENLDYLSLLPTAPGGENPEA